MLMRKRATCALLFVEIRKALKCGRTLKVPQGAAEEGQGDRTGQQKWLWWPEDTVTEAAKVPQPFPSSLSLPGVMEAPAETAWIP